MGTEAYDLHSNIKGKPGSQGTLFQVKDKSLLNPSQRWPRGYSPERQAEVREVTKDIPIEGRKSSDPGLKNKRDHEQRARVEDAVSRSTMPAGSLRGLTKIDAETQPKTRGTYWPKSRKMNVDMFNPSAKDPDEMGQTLIHELGHHVDNMSAGQHSHNRPDINKQIMNRVPTLAAERNPGKEVNTTMQIFAAKDVQAGVAEGFADNHMVDHYRTRGRNPGTVNQGRYERHFSAEERDTQFPGYSIMRPEKNDHMGPQFDQGKLF